MFLPITWKSCYCLYSLNITSKYHMSGVAPMVCGKKLKIKQDSDLYLKSSMLMDLCPWLKLEKILFGLIFMLKFSFFKCKRFFFLIFFNQTKKFGQLIEYTWAIFFLKSHAQNVVTSPRIFYEKSKFNIYPDQQSEMSWSFFCRTSRMGSTKLH